MMVNPPKMSRLNNHNRRDRRASLAMTDIEIATVVSSLAMTDSQADRHVASSLAMTDILSLRTPGVCVHELGDTERGCGNLIFAVG